MITPFLLPRSILVGHQLVHQSYDCFHSPGLERVAADLTALTRLAQVRLGRHELVVVLKVLEHLLLDLGEVLSLDEKVTGVGRQALRPSELNHLILLSDKVSPQI